MDNQKEMDRFLEKFNLPRLNQEEIEILNKTITITEIKTVIEKKSPPKPTPSDFTVFVHSEFCERIITILQYPF